MNMLSPASGPNFGVAGDESDAPFRLAVVGESTAAGTWVGSIALPDDIADFFAEDGFHPSAFGYRFWAQAVLRATRDDGF